MNNEFNWQQLWNQQPVMDAPDKATLFAAAKKLQAKARNKLLVTNILLVLTIAYLVVIIHTFHPQMITTIIGILLVFAAIVMYIIASGNNLWFLFTLRQTQSGKDYLQQLLKLKHKQELLQKTIFTIYYIALCAGIYLYMIEYTLKMSMPWAIIAYTLTTIWFAIAWFYLRPQTIRKQQQPLLELIVKLEKIQHSFNED